MSFAQTTAGAAMIIGFIQFAVVPILPTPPPPPPFLEVRTLEVQGNMVRVDRSYPRDTSTVADWSVVIVPVGHNAPSCHTVHGKNLHEGWSVYDPQPRRIKEFDINTWANDPNCAASLEVGDYRMFTTWTPRDGSAPVVNQTEFTWKAKE